MLTVYPVYAAISSLSLSLLATGIDSVFDIGSNVLLLWLNRKANKLDGNKWPVGGTRLETIGNIVYGALLSFSALLSLTWLILNLRISVSRPCGRAGRALTMYHSMGSVNLVVIVESVRTIVTHNSADKVNSLHVPSLIAVGAALGEYFPDSCHWVTE